MQFPAIRKLIPYNAKDACIVVAKVRTVSPMSDHYSGIQVCFINSDGDAYLHRIKPHPHTFIHRNSDQIIHIPLPKCYAHDISQIMLAPECGTWAPETIDLACVSSDHAWRFTYDASIPIGTETWYMAAVLTAQEPDFRDVEALRQIGLEEYDTFKRDIVHRHISISILGSLYTFMALGPERASAFVVGTLFSHMYHQMLVAEVDAISIEQAQFVSSTTRLAALSILAGVAIHHFHDAIAMDSVLYVMGLLGFVSYKLSLYER